MSRLYAERSRKLGFAHEERTLRYIRRVEVLVVGIFAKHSLKVEVALFAYNDNLKTRSIVLVEQQRQMLVESFNVVLRKHYNGNRRQFATFFLVASIALDRTEEGIGCYRHYGQQQNCNAYYDCYIVD